MVGQRGPSRALVFDAYGPLERLHFANVPEPAPPRRGAVVRVSSVALNPKDAKIRSGGFRPITGFRFPKRCGVDFAGIVTIATPGAGVEPGQRVFGMIDEWRHRRGTLAHEVAVEPEEVAPLPDAVDDDHGAALALTGLTALQALRDVAGVMPGHRVAIHGASGGVGTIAIQVARRLGGTVLATASRANLELCVRLGAEEALPYDTAPIQGRRGAFDCIFDVFGDLGFASVRGALRPGGVYMTTVPSNGDLFFEAVARVVGGRRRAVMVRPSRADLTALAAWVERGELEVVIDSVFPWLSFTDAFRRLESRRARGKVVVRIEE